MNVGGKTMTPSQEIEKGLKIGKWLAIIMGLSSLLLLLGLYFEITLFESGAWPITPPSPEYAKWFRIGGIGIVILFLLFAGMKRMWRGDILGGFAVWSFVPMIGGLIFFFILNAAYVRVEMYSISDFNMLDRDGVISFYEKQGFSRDWEFRLAGRKWVIWHKDIQAGR